MNALKLSDFLRYALENPSPDFEGYSIGEVYLESVRQNDKRPASVKLMVPDDFVKNLRGTEELQDVYLFLKFPRETWDRYNSPIILDGEIK